MLSLYINTTIEELPMIYEFMSHVYMVIQLWMKIFPTKLYKSYQYANKCKKLYLVDFDAALAKAGYELLDMLGKSFGLCSRCLSLYKHFGNAYYFQGSVEAVPYHSDKGFGFMYSLMNMFAEVRGLESVKCFVKDGHPQLGNSVIPIVYMNKVLLSLKYFYQRCQSSVATDLLEGVVKPAISSRINNITEQKETRSLNPASINSLLETLRIYLARRNDYKLAEKLELEVVKKFLLKCK